MPTPITVWEFHEVPKKILAVIENHDDADFIAEVPPDKVGDWIRWLEVPHFGCYRVTTQPHPTKPGWEIRIGYHA